MAMDFCLTSEQRMIQDSMRRMTARAIVPILKANDPDKPLPKPDVHKILELCAAQGLTAPRIPESEGGAGLSAVTTGILYEQLPPAIAFDVLAHEVTAARIHFASTPEQKERFLPDLIAARRIACTATTEPAGGSDTRAIATRATRDGNDWILNGRKIWISGVTTADVINTTASVAGAGGGKGSVGRFLVERGISAYEARTIDTLGLRQAHLGEVVFEDCRVPGRNQCGTIGDAPKVLTLSWLINRPVVGLMAVSMAQTALDAALKYAADRTQFGRPLAQFQLIQELLADISTAITTSRLICYYALASIDNGQRANHVTAMAKRHAIAACTRAVSMAMEIHGATGISTELGLEQLYRDIRMLPIPDGTNQILTLIEGRELTGVQAYRMASDNNDD
jgi:alkylation response protein AidB-like acyl-CoA dehydrogenase